MDQLKLRSLVFEKTGIKIDVDDPVFALVALNEAVLAEAVERHVALLDEATANLIEQAGALLPDREQVPVRRPAAPAHTKPERGAMLLAGGAAVLCALLVLAGQALFLHPAPVPPSTVIAKELTPEQARAIELGEKLGKILPKLDTKTRNAIQAEMQKP